MLKYISKFVMDLLPPVAATIIGAYVVNHYIVTRPGADAPVAAAVSPADPRKAAIRDDAKPPATSIDAANLPEFGLKAKGIATDARHQPTPTREKAVARSTSVQTAPSSSAVTAVPVLAAPNTTSPVEAVVAPEERRDANGLARAAIERLRGASEGAQQTQETARVLPEASRVATAPPVVTTPIRPLPPPITVSTPTAESIDAGTESSQTRSSYPGAGINDPSRPIPPADIPVVLPPSPPSRPLDLRAAATEPLAQEPTTVAEDMLAAAKSVFHAVLPK